MNDLIVKCKKDNMFEFGRNVGYSCGREFIVKENDISSISFPDYEGEEKKQYYVMCPNCGYINILNENILSEEAREEANQRNENIPFQYRMNNLKSELVYLEGIGAKKLTRR